MISEAHHTSVGGVDQSRSSLSGALVDAYAHIAIDGYEAEETETPEERLEHVLEVIRRQSP